MAKEQLTVRSGIGAAGIVVIDAAAEALMATMEDLDRVVVHVYQITDAGTVVAHVEATIDGVSWLQIGANITEASFPAGANTVVERTLSDANAMSLSYRAIRVRASALAAGGVYGFSLAGKERHS